ncbi:MAG: hypothetical protein PGN25_18350 [Methylorubrum populi]
MRRINNEQASRGMQAMVQCEDIMAMAQPIYHVLMNMSFFKCRIEREG